MFLPPDSTSQGTGADENSIYTSADGHATTQGLSDQDKLIGFSSIALGVIAFVVFMCYYCSPFVRERRNAKAAKKRKALLKPFAIDPEKLPKDTGNPSNLTSENGFIEPETPSCTLSRDSLGVTKARQDSTPFDMQLLYHFPSPPRAGVSLSPTYSDPQSPFSGVAVSRSFEKLFWSSSHLNLVPPEHASPCLSSKSSTCVDSPSVGLPFLQSLSGSVVQDRDKAFVSPSQLSFSCPSGPSTPTSPMNSPRLETLPTNHVYGTVLPRSPSPGMHSFPSASKGHVDNIGLSPKSLPYIHSSSAPNLSRNTGAVLARAESQSQTPCNTSASPACYQSLRVRESVFARASKYAWGLVGAAGARPACAQKGTELQFEMVKEQKRRSVLFW
ncbi:hypothetical protein DFH11DRAFT_1056685 [Phellopilus nigrolimitatus]|nr:hypothetical protein DFH11DRAFT_1056685 [Phellopilus nigrolimitatus]